MSITSIQTIQMSAHRKIMMVGYVLAFFVVFLHVALAKCPNKCVFVLISH